MNVHVSDFASGIDPRHGGVFYGAAAVCPPPGAESQIFSAVAHHGRGAVRAHPVPAYPHGDGEAAVHPERDERAHLRRVHFIILLEISLTAIVSRLNDKLTRTIQQTALLEKRVRALEQALEEKEKDA